MITKKWIMFSKKDVINILKSISKKYKCLCSEAQLRDLFAISLGMLYKKATIIPEYQILNPNKNSLQDKYFHLDLFLRFNKKEKYVFEFKYKTLELKYNENDYTISLNNQSDTTNGRYAIWRDIYRIEQLIKNNIIKSGFLIFITNNSVYWNKPRKNSYDIDFSTTNGKHNNLSKKWNLKNKKLNDCTSIQKSYKKDLYPLKFKNTYNFKYENYSKLIQVKKNNKFKRLIVQIR